MKKINKKYINSYMKENGADDSQIVIPYELSNGDKFEVVIKKALSLPETSYFIDRVVDNSFTPEGEYRPEYKEAMIKVAFAECFTNLPILKENDGINVDIDRTAKMVDSLNILPDDILQKQMEQLRVYIDDIISIKADIYVENKSLFNQFFNVLSTFVGNMSSKFGDVDIKQFAKQIDYINNKIDMVDSREVVDSIVHEIHKDKESLGSEGNDA